MRSWSAATWERTSPEFTGCFAAASRFGCSFSGPVTSRASSIDRFDAGSLHPQAELFLRRDLSPAVAVERVFRGAVRASRRTGDLLERRHSLVRPEYVLRHDCWDDPSACSRSGPNWPCSPARRSFSCSAPTCPAADLRLKSTPSAISARRRTDRRHRLPETARSPHRVVPRRRGRPPALAMLRIAVIPRGWYRKGRQ